MKKIMKVFDFVCFILGLLMMLFSSVAGGYDLFDIDFIILATIFISGLCIAAFGIRKEIKKKQ